MSDKDLVQQAALRALSQSSGKKLGEEDKSPATPVVEPAPAKTQKTSPEKNSQDTSTSDKAKLPEKGSAEAESHKQAALAATHNKEATKSTLPQKGSAEAAVHNMAAQEAAGKKSPNTNQHKGESSLGFLFLVLMLPLAIVGGLYAYATYMQDNNAPQSDKNTADKATPKTPKSAAKIEKTPAAPAPTPPSVAKPVMPPVEVTPPVEAPKPQASIPQKAMSPEAAASVAAAPTPASTKTAPQPTKPTETTPKIKPATTTEAPKNTEPKTVTQPATAEHAKTEKGHWDYESTDWASVDPAYKTCGTGNNQSPINIPMTAGNTGPQFQYNYALSAGKLHNNGHTVQVDLDKGNQLLVNGKAYDLIQFHFHTPSENRIHGKSYPMEVHLVHKNAENQLAVVAVMIDQGGTNELLSHMPVPAKKGDTISSGGANINPALLLPANRTGFTFSGSLTTPPCSESVGWIVLQTPIRVESETLARFQKVLGNNNRPIQPTNNRAIYNAN